MKQIIKKEEEKTEAKITAYKGFDKDLKCRGFQYEIGKEYEEKNNINLCDNGFHCCEYPLDVFSYYNPAQNRFAEVEACGQIEKGEDKICCSHIKIGKEITIRNMVEAAIKFTFDRAKWFKKASATGDYGAASATGDYGAASATGNKGAASATGDYGAASATGKESVACGLGFKNKAKGALGCWLVLVEREGYDKNYKIIYVKTALVDGKKIKADTFYVLKNGKFVKAGAE